MRRPYLILLVLVLFCAFCYTAGFGESVVSARITISKADYVIAVRDGYTTVSPTVEAGYFYPGSVGAPMLPAKLASFIVDTRTTAATVQILATYTDIQLDAPLRPKQRPVAGDEIFEFTQPDAAIYGIDSFYPSALHGRPEISTRRGIKKVSFYAHQFAYNPISRVLRIATEMTITVTCKIDGDPTTAPERHFSSFYAEERARTLNPQAEFFPNLSPVGRTLLEAPIDGKAPLSPVDANDVDYLIITSPDLVSSFTELRDWKTRIGYPAEIISTSTIYANYTGVDNQAKIRACIKDYYDNKGTRFVLLGGDSPVVPDRDTYIYVIPSVQYTDMPCDFYYACLDGTWDGDGDGVYGETDDNCDYDPEVHVGRLPIRNATQALAAISKIMAYEKNPPTSNFARNIMFSGMKLWNTGVGADLGYPYNPSDAEVKGDIIYNDSIGTYWAHAATNPADKFYDTKTSWDTTTNGDYPLTAANLKTKFAEKSYNYLMMLTHGNYTVWSMESGGFWTSDAAAMTNTSPVIIYTIACLANGFDAAEPCLSEAFIRNPNGGAVAYMGCSREGWGTSDFQIWEGVSESWSRRFFTYVFDGSENMLGTAFTAHRAYYGLAAKDDAYVRHLFYGVNLMGDPAMMLLTDDPATLSVTTPYSVTTEQTTVTIDVGVVGAMVCLYREPDIYAYGLTGSDGKFNATIDAATNGKVDFVVTAQNYLPYYGSIYLNAPPVITTQSSVYNVFEDDRVTFTLTATDPDLNDTVKLTHTGMPVNAVWNDVTGQFSWIPNRLEAGQYVITYTATDDFADVFGEGANGVTVYTIRINVANVNTAPSFDKSTPTYTVNENEMLTFAVQYTDPDSDDTVLLTSSELPHGASMDYGTGAFSWKPNFLQAGNYLLTFTATDNASLKYGSTVNGFDNFAVMIVVQNVNRPPAIDPIDDIVVNEEQTIDFTATWADPDTDDTLTVSISNAPQGSNFNPATGRFMWTPTKFQEGTYVDITISVNDGHTTITEIFSITVNDPLPPKVIRAESYDTDGNGAIDKVTLFFDEIVIPQTGFIPNHFTIAGISAASYSYLPLFEVDLLFDPQPFGTGVMTLDYQSLAESLVYDSVLNKLETFSIEIEDHAAPVIIAVDVYDENGNGHPERIVFTFSEPLAPSASAIDGWMIIDSSGSVDLLGDYTGITLVHDGATLTFLLSDDKGAPGMPFYRYTEANIKDAAGNIATYNSNTAPAITTWRTLTVVPSMVYLECSPVDPNQPIETLSYLWLQLDGPEVLQIRNGSTQRGEVVVKTAGTYIFIIGVTDAFGDAAYDQLSVTVTNAAPIADAGTTVYINRSITPTSFLDGSASFDPNGSGLTYSWNAPAVLNLSSTAVMSPAIAPNVDGIFTAILTVNDPEKLSSSASVTVVVFSDDNTPPRANAGPDQQGIVGKPTYLDGRASTDADGDSLSYVWTRVSGPTAPLANAGAAACIFTPSAPGVYVFSLTVNDGKVDGMADTVTVSVTTNGTNNPPSANAGGDRTVAFAPKIELNGLASSDADGDPLTYAWTLLKGATTIVNPTTATPHFIPFRPGIFRIQLVVYDGKDFSLPAVITIVVSDVNASPPIVSIGYIAVPDTAVIPTTLYLTNDSTDPDGDPLTYRWELIAGAFSAFDATAQEPEFTPVLPVLHTFRCYVSDGLFTSYADISIAVRADGAKFPEAHANRDKNAFVGYSTNLDHDNSQRWLGGEVLWVQLSGPTTVRLTSYNTRLTSFIPPVEGVYSFAMYITNGDTWSVADSVNVTATKGHPRVKSGCFIASAAFADASAIAVERLCQIRDLSVETSSVGGSLTSLYYMLSPEPANGIAVSASIRALVREFLK